MTVFLAGDFLLTVPLLESSPVPARPASNWIMSISRMSSKMIAAPPKASANVPLFLFIFTEILEQFLMRNMFVYFDLFCQ